MQEFSKEIKCISTKPFNNAKIHYFLNNTPFKLKTINFYYILYESKNQERRKGQRI